MHSYYWHFSWHEISAQNAELSTKDSTGNVIIKHYMQEGGIVDSCAPILGNKQVCDSKWTVLHGGVVNPWQDGNMPKRNLLCTCTCKQETKVRSAIRKQRRKETDLLVRACHIGPHALRQNDAMPVDSGSYRNENIAVDHSWKVLSYLGYTNHNNCLWELSALVCHRDSCYTPCM